MSSQSLHDTAIDFDPIGPPAPPWRAPEAAAWAAAVGVVAGGAWLAAALARHLLPSPIPINAHLQVDRLEVVTLLAFGGGVAGLCVGGLAGLVCGRSARVRSGFAWGVGLAGAAALAGGLVPLAATALKPLPATASTTLVWVVVGALVGLAGYACNRRPVRAAEFESDQRPTWRLTGAVGWGVTVGGLAAAAWYGELALLRRLPGGVQLGPLVYGNELRLAVGAALLGGIVGLAAGATFGVILGRPSRLTAGLRRGLGFAGVGAAGGGLFPLAASATDLLSPELSSALTWGVVAGLSAMVAYTWTRWPRPERLPAAETDDPPAADRETVVVRSGVRLGGSPAERSGPVPMAVGRPGPADDELSPALTSDWDPGPVRSLQTKAPPTAPRVVPTARSTTTGAVVRVAPVLMVTVVCLLAVGLSTPSPVGWAMLGVGLLGLAASWALVGQERRIRELERRVGGR